MFSQDESATTTVGRRLRFVHPIVWILIGGVVTGAVLMSLGLVTAPEGHIGPEENVWTCPMHPEVITDEPGSCPICGMDLIPVEVAGVSGEHRHVGGGEAHGWTCSMCPQVREDGPGSCPVCGMHLVPAADGSDSDSAGDVDQLWTCGMDPQVLEPGPGSCPICGMDLVPVAGTDGIGAGLGTGDGAVVTIDAATQQNMNVTTRRVERRDISHHIRTVGYLEYDQERMVSVTTKYKGFIEKTFVNSIGQPVAEGEPLFEIYSPELVQTEQELLSAKKYADQMGDSRADVRDRAVALLEAARLRLAYWDVTPEQISELEESGVVQRTIQVLAPASGVVMKRMPGLDGMAVHPGMELLHIVDLSHLWLTVDIFENQLPWLRVGSRADITMSYFPGEAFSGRVRYIEPEVSKETRSVRLTLDIANPQGDLKVGMYATVVFEPTVASNVVTVPSSAVLRTGQRNLVILALGGGRFAPREVVLGPSGGEFVQVKQGLEEGAEIVTSAQFLIDSESNLREAIQKMLAERANPESTTQTHGG